MDSGLVYNKGEDKTDGIIGIQVDDTICTSTKLFAAEEELASREFLNKRKVDITETLVRLNVVELAISDGDNNLIMRQLKYIIIN